MPLTQDDDHVGLYIVIPKGENSENCHCHLREAYDISVKNGFHPSWIEEEECLAMKPTKRNVFVFQHFTGPSFEHLKAYNCVLVGPRCLISSQATGHIPLVNYPMYTAAMRDLCISISGGGVKVKDELKEKIELMSGKYTHRLLEFTTHLVVNSVLSDKYEKAMLMGIKVYTFDWIKAVWLKSLTDDVHGTDQQFNRYMCPPFLNLIVCTSNLSTSQTKLVKQKVTNNGGVYDATYTIHTSVLVVRGYTSEKFKVAKSRNIPCVSVDWIVESEKKGYALPTKDFEVDGTSSSSPGKGNKGIAEFCDDVDISTIPFGNRTHVDETLMNSTTSSVASYCPQSVKTPVKADRNPTFKTPVKSLPLCDPGEMKHLLQQIDVAMAKAAGSFLDGCRVYLYGWNSEEEEKLRKILKSSGAARFTELNDRTSHVLVGKMDKPLERVLNRLTIRPHVVSIKWLIESMSQKQPAQEEKHACFLSENPAEAPSPLSKKGMAILQQGMMSPNNKVQESKEPEATDKGGSLLLQKYQGADSTYESDLSTISLRPVGTKSDSASAMPPPPVPCRPVTEAGSLRKEESVVSTVSNSSYTCSDIEEVMVFNDLKFVNLDTENTAARQVITDCGGEIVSHSYSGKIDYAITPLAIASVPRVASNLVTTLWLKDCVSNQELCTVEYYHRPVVMDVEKKPLQNCVLGVSGYTHLARQFAFDLAQLLGAKTQEVFARTDKPNAKASTHLICKTSEPSHKYNAAVKWGLPAVTHEWLLACASSGTRVSERPYLLNANLELPDGKPSSDINTVSAHSLQSPRVTALQSNGGASTPLRHDPAELRQLLEKPLPPNPFIIKTPETPLGVSKNPDKEESKKYARWIKNFPNPLPKEPNASSNSPSLEEVRRLMIGKCGEHLKAQQNASTTSSKSSLPLVRNKSSPETNKSPPETNENSPKPPIDGRLDKLKKLIETPDLEKDESPFTTKRTLFQHAPVPFGPLKSDPINEASQPYAIMWEDPVNIDKVSKEGLEKVSTEKKTPLGEAGSSKKRKSSESGDDLPAVKLPNRMLSKTFLLSCVEDKEQYTRIINELKGNMLDTNTFDVKATHLVLDRPARSEKLLSAIASGLWILHTSYLTESCKRKAFLKEELYEFGSFENQRLDKFCTSTTEKALAKAAHRWRSTLSKSHKKGAFDGMRFVILTSREKVAPFSRLVTAGGGEVVSETAATKGAICCVDQSKVKIDYSQFAKKDIVCVPIMFLNDFLLLDPPPTPESKAIEDFKVARLQLGN